MATSRDLTVTLTLDTSTIEAMMTISLQMKKIRAAMTLSQQKMGVFVYALDTFAKTEAQIEAIYYARGAMDARYELPADRDAYLRVLLHAGEHSDVAVAGFLRGWVEHRGRHLEVHPLTWHRYISGSNWGVRFEVSAA